MTDEVECLSICLLIIWLLFYYEFMTFAHFQLAILLICKSFLYILDARHLLDKYIGNISSSLCELLFKYLNDVFLMKKHLFFTFFLKGFTIFWNI